MIAWIAAEAERGGSVEAEQRRSADPLLEDLVAHSFPRVARDTVRESQTPHPSTGSGQAFSQNRGEVGNPEVGESEEDEQWWRTEDSEEQRQRRIYRGRTVAMLRKYMRYSIETGRMPSLLGREFFRSKVTSYTVVTFEDRVIFVHDMETCLYKLDEFSRQIIARRILQEHDRFETARLLHCNEKTIRRLTPLVIDLFSEILLDVGLMERVEATIPNSCQGGKNGHFSVSDCEEGENKV
jgi:hypothetical protein